MGIGKRIKEARNKLGYTQEQLAELVGVKKSAIANYENDISSPREEILIKLFAALKVDANYLFQDDLSPQVKAIINTKNITLAAHRTDGYDTDLPEEAQEELKSYIEFLKMKYKKKD